MRARPGLQRGLSAACERCRAAPMPFSRAHGLAELSEGPRGAESAGLGSHALAAGALAHRISRRPRQPLRHPLPPSMLAWPEVSDRSIPPPSLVRPNCGLVVVNPPAPTHATVAGPWQAANTVRQQGWPSQPAKLGYQATWRLQRLGAPPWRRPTPGSRQVVGQPAGAGWPHTSPMGGLH